MSALPAPDTHKDRLLVERYRRIAWTYDAAWARYTVGTLRKSLSVLQLRGDERILDIGCGTGELERLLLPRWPDLRIVGLDLSQHMLDLAAEKFSPRFSLRLLRGHAQRLPFGDASFDVVLNLNAFHYFSEPVATLSEFRRVLAPGGIGLLTDWCTDRWMFRAIDLGMRLFDRAHHRIHRSRALLDALQQAGFEEARLETYGVGWFWGMAMVWGRAPRPVGTAPTDPALSSRGDARHNPRLASA